VPVHLFSTAPERHPADDPGRDAREVAQQLQRIRRDTDVATREEMR